MPGLGGQFGRLAGRRLQTGGRLEVAEPARHQVLVQGRVLKYNIMANILDMDGDMLPPGPYNGKVSPRVFVLFKIKIKFYKLTNP